MKKRDKIKAMNERNLFIINGTLKALPKTQLSLCNGDYASASVMSFLLSTISSRVNRFPVLRSYESMKELTAHLKKSALSTLTTDALDNLTNLKKMSQTIMKTVSHFLQDFKRAVTIWLQSCINIYKKRYGRNYGSIYQP